MLLYRFIYSLFGYGYADDARNRILFLVIIIGEPLLFSWLNHLIDFFEISFFQQVKSVYKLFYLWLWAHEDIVDVRFCVTCVFHIIFWVIRLSFIENNCFRAFFFYESSLLRASLCFFWHISL